MTAERKYRILLSPVVEDGTIEWAAEVPELEGCLSYGDTPEEALLSIKDAQDAWIHATMEAGWDLPEPVNESIDYSGKFTVRIPKSLHRHLSNMAYLEGVSLNQYVLHLLGRGKGSSSLGTGELQRCERTTTTEVVKQTWSDHAWLPFPALRSSPTASSRFIGRARGGRSDG